MSLLALHVHWFHWHAVLHRAPEWLTAVGTIGAVIVALWLSNAADRRAAARRPLLWTHVGGTRLTIPPGVMRSIDVARVHISPPDGQGLDGVLELLVEPVPGNYRNRLQAGTYELHMTLSSRNANAVEYVTRVSFDSGQETPHEMITVLDPPTPVELYRPLPDAPE